MSKAAANYVGDQRIKKSLAIYFDPSISALFFVFAPSFVSDNNIGISTYLTRTITNICFELTSRETIGKTSFYLVI